MMNSTNKLSVIIPLYNAGDDFRTCMESLITQTWTALEIPIGFALKIRYNIYKYI